MKKSILILTTAIFLIGGTAVLSSCGSDDNTDQQEHSDGDMHNDGDNHTDGDMMMNHSGDTMNMDTNHEAADSDSTDVVYACPMHHNITGKKGDKCSICGMKLTNTKTDPAHKGHTHMHNN